MQPALALGLMSGTSADGVSAALIWQQGRRIRLLAFQTTPYSPALRRQILKGSALSAREIASLNFQLGEIFAKAAQELIRKTKTPTDKIRVIGSHGQTIYHNPSRYDTGGRASTLQIGEAAVIAEKTKISVVADFRPTDIAAGGQGAPLVPAFDHFLFGKGPARILLNVGGIANLTLAGKGLRPLACDTGPGNCLIDLAVRKLGRGRYPYDRDGRLAAQGVPDLPRIRRMLRHPYFSQPPPKSTGRELFNENFLKRYGLSLAPRKAENLIATLTFLTAASIAQNIRLFIFSRCRPQELIVSGGGALNRTLMGHLRQLLEPFPIRRCEEFGIPAQAAEPMAFAWMALQAIRGKSNHLPETTGAKGPRILGKLHLPPPPFSLSP